MILNNLHRVAEETAVELRGPYEFRAFTGCFPQQRQTVAEILLIDKGAMTLTINGENYRVQTGEAALLPPGALCSAKTAVVPLLYHSMRFDVNAFLTGVHGNLRLMLPIAAGKTAFPAVIRDADTVQTVRVMLDACRGQDYAGSLFVTACVYRLFGLLYRRAMPQSTPAPVADPSMREVLDYIDAHFTEPLSVAEISRQFGYAESHFCRRFKDTTGLTPVHYIRSLRMELARRMLSDGHHSISEVAVACGFPDSSYFTRCFKKVYGRPPSQFGAVNK